MAKGGTVVWDTTPLESLVERQMGLAAERSGRYLRKRQKEMLDTPYPPSSKPGQSPRRRTGKLRRSVNYETTLATGAGFFDWVIRSGPTVLRDGTRVRVRPKRGQSGRPYGLFQEVGFMNKLTGRFEPARPFMRPTLDEYMKIWPKFFKRLPKS